MRISQLLTPITHVHWLAATDTVQDALDHMETYEITAAPLVDWNGRYLGTVTGADVRRHLTGTLDRVAALATPLARIGRGAHYDPVEVGRDLDSLDHHAFMLCFVPVVDGAGKLLGIIERKRLTAVPTPTAA